ncbi:AAA family ATPase [Ktedonosporobacter rubrisoli]|nr:ATP-binding protein [Ktedonosporobacter rubrisoli]
MKKLLIICGISFAGKSTLARALTERFHYPEVDVDEVKYELYGSAIQDEELRPEDWERTYAETDQRIEHYLQAGKSVVDASRYFTKQERELARRIAMSQNAELVTIFVDTPKAVAQQRLLANRENPARRNVTDADFAAILEAMEPPTADEQPLVLPYGEQIEHWIARNISALS